MTGDLINIEQLAIELAERLPQPLPISVQLWTGDMVAQYLVMDERYVKEKLLIRPNAPKAIRMYNTGKPRYKASEVIQWAESFQEKRRAA
ncbi:MAG: hypothetical protein QFB87_05595 [Patescibacteria group bacterium]|nr:hypothetical protein [Patescibacteria group bacterium]